MGGLFFRTLYRTEVVDGRLVLLTRRPKARVIRTVIKEGRLKPRRKPRA